MRMAVMVAAGLLMGVTPAAQAVDLKDCGKGTTRQRLACMQANTVLLNSSYQTVAAELRRNAAESKRQLDALAGEVTATKGELAALKGDAASLKGEVASLRSEAAALKGAVAALKSEAAAVKGAVAALKGEVTATRGELAALKGEVASLKGEAASLKGEVASLKGEVASLKGEVAALKGEVTHMVRRDKPVKFGFDASRCLAFPTGVGGEVSGTTPPIDARILVLLQDCGGSPPLTFR